MLRHFGIDPIEFLRETRGSIKLGIRHKDWRRVGHTYHGPIDEPHQMVKGAGDSQFLNVYEIAAGTSGRRPPPFRYVDAPRPQPLSAGRPTAN